MESGLSSSALRRGALTAALVAGLLGVGPRARAEASADDKALATTLFREARALMTEGRTPEACAKFEESHRLDPSGGTILNLALCHEKEGKLARSWSEFSEAIAFARRDYRADREAEAQDHANKLEPRLSRLTVVVSDAAKVEGLRVERDGRDLAPPSWSLAIPVDGGAHTVRATAPGRMSWSQSIDVPNEGGAVTIEIPGLALAPPPPPAPHPPPPSIVLASPPAPEGNPRRTAAWITGAAAVVQLGAAGYFGLQAISLKSDINRNDEALRDADRSTLLTITGLVTAGVSAYLFWTSRRAHHD
jgi:tetratricopeptide (TPR) repeat protein